MHLVWYPTKTMRFSKVNSNIDIDFALEKKTNVIEKGRRVQSSLIPLDELYNDDRALPSRLRIAQAHSSLLSPLTKPFIRS